MGRPLLELLFILLTKISSWVRRERVNSSSSSPSVLASPGGLTCTCSCSTTCPITTCLAAPLLWCSQYSLFKYFSSSPSSLLSSLAGLPPLVPLLMLVPLVGPMGLVYPASMSLVCFFFAFSSLGPYWSKQESHTRTSRSIPNLGSTHALDE